MFRRKCVGAKVKCLGGLLIILNCGGDALSRERVLKAWATCVQEMEDVGGHQNLWFYLSRPPQSFPVRSSSFAHVLHSLSVRLP